MQKKKWKVAHPESRTKNEDYEGNNRWATPQERRADRIWRERVLELSKPVIPFTTKLPEHEYQCVEMGPVGRYPNLYFIIGETYWVSKCRWSEDRVEIRGAMFKRDPDRRVEFRHQVTCLKENCKKYLKLKSVEI